jgi:indole-3-glycerol phosphate synthase
MNAKLRPIIEAVKAEITASKQARPVKELKARIRDLSPLSGRFSEALKGKFGLIAEIKEKSPSAGLMKPENVKDAYTCYEKSSLVRAVSVLTNKVHFGMSIDRLQDARNRFSKPILRKDFIVDEYQIYEARAYGADAILLMGNVLDSGKLFNFWQTAKGLGLEVLFEAHTAAHAVYSTLH